MRASCLLTRLRMAASPVAKNGVVSGGGAGLRSTSLAGPALVVLGSEGHFAHASSARAAAGERQTRTDVRTAAGERQTRTDVRPAPGTSLAKLCAYVETRALALPARHRRRR